LTVKTTQRRWLVKYGRSLPAKHRFTFAILLVFASISAVVTPSNDSHYARANPARQSAELTSGGPTGTPAIRWRRPVGTGSSAAPAIHGDLVLNVTADGRTQAFDLNDGTAEWEGESTATFSTGPVAVDGVLYTVDDGGRLVARTPGSGERIWQIAVGPVSQPLIAADSDVIVINTGLDRLVVFDAGSGERLWSAAATAGSTPGIADGSLYIGAGDGKIHAYQARTGEEQWIAQTGDWVQGAPVLAETIVYAGSSDGYVYALDAADGSEVWRYAIGEIVSAGLAVSDRVVYAGAWDRLLTAIDAETGEAIWRTETAGRLLAAPAVAGEFVYAATEGGLYVVDVATGHLRWRFATGGAVDATPVIADGILVATSRDGYLYAIGDAPPPTAAGDVVRDGVPTVRGNAARTGIQPGPGFQEAPELRWRFEMGATIESPPVIGEGLLFASGNDFLHALEPATGDEIWRFQTGFANFASPTIANGVVYAGGPKGFFAIDAGDGSERWRFTSAGTLMSSPAVADGRVYAIFGRTRSLHALDAETGSPIWAVPIGQGTASPAVYENLVYSGGDGVTAVDIATGAIVWHYESELGVNSTPAVDHGAVYVQVDGNLVALDAMTGTLRWEARTGPSGSSAAVAGSNVYVGGYTDLHAFDTKTGQELWRFPIGQALGAASTPVVVGRSIYIAGNSGADLMISVDARTGNERWRVETGGGYGLSSPVIIGGVMYVSEAQSVAAFSAAAAVVDATSEATARAGASDAPPVSGRIDAARSGVTTETGPTELPAERWLLADGATLSPPVVSNGRVYANSEYGLLLSVDELTGAVIWQFQTAGSGGSTPAVAGGLVFVPGRDGTLTAVNEGDGTERWTYQASDGVWSPVVVDGIVIASALDGSVFALDAATGVEVWNVGLIAQAWTPAVADGQVYVGDGATVLVALDSETGAELWRAEDAGGIASTPAVVDGIVYVVAADFKLIALDAATGARQWQSEASGGADPAPSVAGGRVYLSDGSGVVAVDAETGEILWRFEAGLPPSAPVVAGNLVYISGVYDGTIIALDALTGAELWRLATGDLLLTTPAVSAGALFVGGANGLHAYGE